MSEPSRAPTRAESLYLRWLELRGAQACSLTDYCLQHPGEAAALAELHVQHLRLESLNARDGADGFGARLRSWHGDDVDPEVELEREETAPDPASAVLERLGGRAATWSRYHVKGEIERGGQGAVLRVWDGDLRRTLAMKVLLDADGAAPAARRRRLARFLEEAQVTGQLDHPGIVPVHELGLDAAGRVYFTMRLVRGRDLAAVLEHVRSGRDGWTRLKVLEVLLRVCEAMSYAHAKGVIHRDLKPSNVMVGDYGEVYVMDWGLARVLGHGDADAPRDVERAGTQTDPALHVAPDDVAGDGPAGAPRRTLSGDVLGTPAYMPPEQAAGELAAIGPAADVYAVGALLYHLLAGTAPFTDRAPDGDHRALLAAVRAGPPRALRELARDVPAELEAICDKAMARSQEQRYRSMSELGLDLRAWIEGRVVRAHRTGAWVELVKWTRRNALAAGAIGAAFLLLCAGLGIALVLNERVRESEILATQLAGQRGTQAQLALAESRRATQAEAEARRLLAESYVANAQIADRRGRWEDVLVQVQAARDAGWEDRLGARLLEARSLQALARIDEAQAVLEELVLDGDLQGERRGRALLMLSDLLLPQSEDLTRPLALATEALELGLAPADEHHARCLLAPTVAIAFEEAGLALEADRYHLGANRTSLALLFLVGRRDEALARAETYRAFYPDDSLPDLIEAALLELEGRSAQARLVAERGRRLMDERGAANLDLLLTMMRELRAAYDVETFLGMSNAGSLAAAERIHAYYQAWKETNAPAGLRLPLLPCLRRSWGEASQGIATLMGIKDALSAVDSLFSGKKGPKQDRFTRARPFFERARAASPEALFAYFEAACVMNDPQRPGADPTKLREAEALYRAACEAHSILPGVVRAARLWGTLAQAALAGGDQEMRARALAGLTSFAALPDLHRTEADFLKRYALDMGEPELALALDIRSRAGAPADRTSWLIRARTYLSLGRREQARDALGQVLAIAADDAEALDLLESLAAPEPAQSEPR